MKKKTIKSPAILYLAVFTLLALLQPFTANAQKDPQFSDNNDKMNIPFEITTIQNGEFASDTHWYSIQVSSGKYWHTQSESEGVFCSFAPDVQAKDDAFLWCFTGDNISGYRIYNKAKGAQYIVYGAKPSTHEALTMSAIPTTHSPRAFKLGINQTGYTFYYPERQNCCINDVRGKGQLALWVNSNAMNDGGCRMAFKLVIGDPNTPSSDGLPFKPTKMLSNGKLASNTHWYTMTIRNNKNIYAENGKLLCNEKKYVTENQLWAFVGTKETGFQIYNLTTGSTHRVYAKKAADKTEVVMDTQNLSIGTYNWMLSDNRNGGCNLHYPRYGTSCWNDYGTSGVVCIWRSPDAPNDGGSNIVFNEQNLNNIGEDILVTAIKPLKPKLVLIPGEKATITCTVEPNNATSKALWFASQDENICKVNNTTGEVTAVNKGETNIIIYPTDGSNCNAICKVVVNDGNSLVDVEGVIRYVYRTDNGVDAFPEAYLSNWTEQNGTLQITAKDGSNFTYHSSEYKQVSTEAPTNFAQFTSFNLSRKDNRDLVGESLGTIVNDSLIQLSAVSIGKWLAPTFELNNTTDAKVYVRDVEQHSRITRNSFKEKVTYTVSRTNYKMLRTTLNGKFIMLPFGKEYQVSVNFATDKPSSTYNVPAIYITTADGTPINSKTTYKKGAITIDGVGIFPNLPETTIYIKGRGNSSWSDNVYAKNPYHFKFYAKTSVLGLTKGKHWNLIANSQPMSMMSNAIGMKVARLVGAQGANDEIPVELYINGEYRGSYNLTEKVGFGYNSLNVSDTLVNATMLELDSYFDEYIKFRTSQTFYNLPVNVKEPENFYQDYIKMNLLDIKRRFIPGFLSALKQGNGIEKHVNVNSLATFLMTNELVCNYELMHPKSTFCFCRDILNTDSLFYFGPVWDLDWAFGYEQYKTYFQMPPTEDYWTKWAGSTTMEAWKFIHDLRYNSGEVFEREYFRVWTDFMQNHLQELLDFCDEYQNYAQPSFDHNGERWGAPTNYAEQMRDAKKWISTRAEHVYNYLANTLGYAEKYPDVIEDPTPIIDIAEDKTPQQQKLMHIYTLDGRIVNAKGRLPRGIYIIQGRKVAVH